MPTIDKRYLSKAQLRTPNPGRLQPTLLNPGTGQQNLSGAALRSPGRITPVQDSPVLNRDIIGPAIKEAGPQLGRAALAWANDRAELEANDAVIGYQQRMRDAWLGTSNPDGTFKAGFSSTKGKDSVQKYPVFEADVAQLRDEIINSLDKNAQSRFIQKTQAIHNGYLNSAASHAASGKQVWQTDQIKQQGQQLSIELSDSGLQPSAVQKKLATYATDITDTLGPAAAQPVLQNYYRQHAAFLSEEPEGMNKLHAFKEILQAANAADQETLTTINSEIRTVTHRNVTEERQIAAEADRLAREAREQNGLELRSKLWAGETIPENELHGLLKARKIDPSTHDYLVFSQREGASIPPLSGSQTYDIKADILYGRVDSSDIDNLRLNTADNKALHSYLLTTQSQQVNSDLRAMRQEIQRLGTNPLFPSAANSIFSASESAEAIYLKAKADGKPISAYDAVQRATSKYFNNQLTSQQSPPPVKIGPFSQVPKNEAHLKELYTQWKKGSEGLTPEQRNQQFDIFKYWRTKFEADQKATNLRTQQLEDTTKP